MAKTNTIDYRDGGLEFAKRIEINLKSGNLTLETFYHELNAWNSAQYENNRSKVEVETAALASNAAQVREFVKAVNSIAPAIEGANKALKSVGLEVMATGFKTENMVSDAFSRPEFHYNPKNGY